MGKKNFLQRRYESMKAYKIVNFSAIVSLGTLLFATIVQAIGNKFYYCKSFLCDHVFPPPYSIYS